MRGIALHRSNELRNQIVPLLELDIDISESILTVISQFNQTVVDGDSPQAEDCDHSDDNQNSHIHKIFRTIILFIFHKLCRNSFFSHFFKI